jgi:geranylgeranyl reductase family protein
MHDVVVVGAGPGGSATASFLARGGLDVLLIDRASFPRDKTCGDGLTPRALAVLEDMNLLKELAGVGLCANGLEIHAPSGAVIRMPVPHKPGYPHHFLVVPRHALDDRIRMRALRSGATFHGGVHIQGVEQMADRLHLTGQRAGHDYQAEGRVLVLALGANMRLLQELGFLSKRPRVVLAARAYFEGVAGLTDRLQARFAGVPLPGYGWVFPLSPTSANIGLGFWPRGPWSRGRPGTAAAAFQRFVEGPDLRDMLAAAEQTGPVRSYPIRTDFPSTPTSVGRILLVGESAGLVSPLTGEGIDFALESGKMAAHQILEMFEAADFSRERFSRYDRSLREAFLRLFRFLRLIRALYINPLLLERFIAVAGRRPELKSLLVDILVGHEDAAKGLSFSTLRKVLFGL